MGSTKKLIETAFELQFSKIGYFFDSRHALVEECMSLREQNAVLISQAASKEAQIMAFARSLMQCMETLDAETRAKFAARGVGIENIEQLLVEPLHSQQQVVQGPQANEQRADLTLVSAQPKKEKVKQETRPASENQRSLIDRLVKAGEIPPTDDLYQAFCQKATFNSASALLDRYYGPRNQSKACCQ